MTIIHPCRATARKASASRPTIPQALQRASHELDMLLRDASEIRNQRDYDALEERAQAIAASILLSFRCASDVAPTAPPLAQMTQGARSCAWY